MKKTETILAYASAIILLQTLFFKFTGAEESLWIFEQLGAEPWGRIGSGVVELVAAILLLMPSFRFFGAIIATGTMFGAIFSHAMVLGINVKDDGGLLFSLAVFVFASGLFIIYRNRPTILGIKKWISLR